LQTEIYGTRGGVASDGAVSDFLLFFSTTDA
jgi:hypothetical protein